MMRVSAGPAALFAAVVTAACGGGNTPPPGSEPAPGPERTAKTGVQGETDMCLMASMSSTPHKTGDPATVRKR